MDGLPLLPPWPVPSAATLSACAASLTPGRFAAFLPHWPPDPGPAELFEELQDLPEALQSDFPDLAVDFLATVFRPLPPTASNEPPPR